MDVVVDVVAGAKVAGLVRRRETSRSINVIGVRQAGGKEEEGATSLLKLFQTCS